MEERDKIEEGEKYEKQNLTKSKFYFTIQTGKK